MKLLKRRPLKSFQGTIHSVLRNDNCVVVPGINSYLINGAAFVLCHLYRSVKATQPIYKVVATTK